MSSIVLPSRGRCTQITDGIIQPCQCLWFFPPESSLSDPNTCGLCEHGIHAHADYFSIVVNHYPANQCAAYAQTTHMMQFCTCGAQFCEHIGTYNLYRIPEPWTVLHYFNPDNSGPPLSTTSNGYPSDVSSPFSPNLTPSSNYSTPMLIGDTSWPAVPLAFTPTYMPSPSPNANTSYPYGGTVIFTPTPQRVAQMAIPQIGAEEVEHSHGVQFQDNNFSVNVQDSSGRIHQDHPFDEVHGAEAEGPLE